ncbi:MAG: ABC transporter permease, partial [Rhizobiaceae bacterium]|nr:ABC transporter permease [Rhizobiaceae bacterium]
VANLLYLPLAYLGGLWMPPEQLPAPIAEISQFTPTRHAGEIAWAIVGGYSIPFDSVIWLAGFSALFALLAYWGYQRDERQRYA